SLETKERLMKRILFVDDDLTAHALLKGMLPDWQIISAHSGVEALEILEQEYGLIVITDIHMPKMDGITLLKNIREKHPMVQVIVLSATDQSNNLLAAYQAGANDFISKPFERDEIIEALANTQKKIDRWEHAMGNLYEKKGKNW
ncbi:MAG: two component transcriptional regulator, partial [Candidatus Magnetoglobus multicellularis str. Araruama]